MCTAIRLDARALTISSAPLARLRPAPCVCVQVTLSANKLIGQLGQSFPIPQTNFPFHAGSHNLNNSLCLLVSHSGGTFGTLACSNLLKSFTSHIFCVTSEWDTQVARSIRQGIGTQTTSLQVRSYVFVTHVGLRPAEPCTISVAATHQLLTQACTQGSSN